MTKKFVSGGLGSSEFWAMVNGLWPGKPQFTESDYPKLDGKVVIVTGATAGFGYETKDAIKRLELEIAKEFGKTNLNVDHVLVDFAVLTTIKPAAEEFLKKESRLDIIIHNAGVMNAPDGSVTKQGFELHIGTNNLGPHLLEKFLDPIIIKTSQTNKPGGTRIVWVSSFTHYFSSKGGLFYSNPNFRNTKAVSAYKYGQSKAISILQAKGWNSAHPGGSNIISVSLCPGFLHTELTRHSSAFEQYMASIMTYHVRNGAYTELFAAFSPGLSSGDHIESFGRLTKAREDLEDPVAISKAWDYLDSNVASYICLNMSVSKTLN
ncbi:short-chain alcohol dehydrogenase [Scheffersomyces coipomensis]|uniref:short-chain alcohol dehydrogenase n=1 Tax=Scheffersomyces coipomensis TaxID=1788519 RepID=UPI00315CA169